MLYKINAYLIKLLLNPFDTLGRMFTFNNEMPAGSRMVKDIAYGQHRLQRYDLILPDEPNPNAPVIAYIHGGGWVVGHKNGFRRMGAVWARLGFPVININYRLGPRHNWRKQTHDIHNAIRHAQARLAQSEGLARPLILGGDSAGAHLSSWYAAAAHNPALAEFAGLEDLPQPESIKGLLLFYGLYKLESAYTSGFNSIKTYIRSLLGEDTDQHTWQMLSPLIQIGDAYPPALICAIDNDHLYQESLALIELLKERGLPHHEVLILQSEYKYARHGLINVYMLPFAKFVMGEVEVFLEERCEQKSNF